MTTYTEAKQALNEIAERATQNTKRVAQARTQVNSAVGDYAAMQTAYSAIVTDIETQAAANPDDPAWAAAKAEKDLLVADFLAAKATAQAILAAIDGV